MRKILLSIASFFARILPTGIKGKLYKLGPLARAIRYTLNLAAPTDLTEIEISAGGLAGMKLFLDLHSEKDYWLGTYETELQAAIRKFVKPSWTACDVGANIGYISLLLAQAIGKKGTVFSFEALPSNIERLQANVTLNGLDSSVQVIHGAVGAASAPVKFLIGPSGAMGKVKGSAGRTNGHVDSIDVPGYSLDEFVYRDGNPSPQIVKMDIEGGEVLALPGMKRLLSEARPLIFLELHGPESAQVAWETFVNAGYRIALMKSNYPEVPSVDDLDWKSYIIAFP
ncbi:MAG: FkbM family methyltransferase [Anaerolineales bacterium]|nr:FkbM family methyltransferase [Chloroflexota bacterium]MBL6982982.1 FkbM family methyltransferase [Anaerolineales bacterium]